MNFECTLLSDGSSDKILIPSIKWLLVEHFPDIAFNFESVHAGRLGKDKSFSEKICLALELFPCDILFIHRDVEKETYQKRSDEISASLKNIECELPQQVIPVIPCRMSEAWLLIDKIAIRQAAGNINGKVKLNLPKLNNLEYLPDPKEDLVKILKEATELNKRRLSKFKPRAAMHVLSESIENYSPLRQLSSFNALEDIIRGLDLNN